MELTNHERTLAKLTGDCLPPDWKGRWLGYPSCCVENFNERVRAFQEGRFKDIPQRQKLDGTGFVPCPECNATKSEAQLREEIARNRICPIPFPEYDVE